MSSINDYLYQMNLSFGQVSNSSSVASALDALSGGAATNVKSAYTGFGSITDQLDLSSKSLSAYNDNWVLNQLRGVTSETIGGKYKTLSQVGADLMEDLNNFASLAGGLFSAAGVTSPVTLQMNGVGGLFQVGETADSGKVKSVLNGEHGGKLASQFALAAARSAILEAAKDPQFTSDYNANPPATMEKYEDQLKDLMLRCQLTLDKGQVTTGFAAA